MLPLPDTLLLFALHDDKGTVQAAAFLALDHALRGAALSELRLKGHVQTRSSGEFRLHPHPPGRPVEPVLAATLDALEALDGPCQVSKALDAVQRAIPDIRDDLVDSLTARGILREASVERMGLPTDTVHPLANGRVEAAARSVVRDGLSRKEAVSPRVGLLIGFVVAAHLEDDLFGAQADEARELAGWVAARDSTLRAVREAVELVEGW